MISLSVKEGKIVDHYVIMSTDFGSLWSKEQLHMGPGSHSHTLPSSIDEYEVPEEEYDDEDDDIEGEEEDDNLDDSLHHESSLRSTPKGNHGRGNVDLHHNKSYNHEDSFLSKIGTGSSQSHENSTVNSGLSFRGSGSEATRNTGGKFDDSHTQSSSPGSGSSSGNGHRHDHDHNENGNDDLIPKNFNFIRLIKKLMNVTRDTGQNIRFECEAEGIPPPREIKWYKNGVQNQLKADRFRIRQTRRKTAEGKRSAVRIVGSTLKIRKLEVLDKGFYTCEAVSQGDRNKISSTAILDVRHDADLDSGVIPDFPSAFDSFPEIGERGSMHQIDSFHHVPMLANTGGIMDMSNANAHATPPNDGEGKCQVYKGAVCKRFIDNRLIYVHSEESQVMMETKLKEALNFIEHSRDISPRCSEYAIPSLCFSAFPICHDNPGSGAAPPRRLCREECELLERDLCRDEFTMAKQHPLIGQPLPIPKCEELPPVGSKQGENCVRLGLPDVIPLVDNHSCFKGKGLDYRGKVKETKEGKQCRPWNHQINFKATNYPELMGGHNFCRNPGGLEEQPWCFSSSGHFKRVPCKVQRCGMFGSDNKIWVPIAGGTAAFLLVLLMICLMCRCRKSKSKTSGTKSILSLEMGSLVPKSGHLSAKVPVPEVPIGNIQFLQELGEGAYGKVYKGEALLSTGEPIIPVAIKTLKAIAAQRTRQDFFREADLMAELKHPNIICVLGMVTEGEPKCIIFEYLPHGDLHEYLISHSSRNNGDYRGHKILEQNEMLFIATQIAAGMEYLAAHHYVHRDLAARNALVGESLTVKISGFGLSREIYSSDYYLSPSKSLVPVRWMPPESILYGKFTTESDVWAFGVVLWEIYSYGLQPYQCYSNQQVIEMIRSHQILPFPDNCPANIYALMVECWAEIPHRRPSFEEIHSRLKQWLLPLLGPSSTFTQHLNCTGVVPGSLSCRSNNSMSSHHSSNTGPPTSNNTNSTNISQFPRNAQQSPSQCVAYQTTSIIPCSMPINNGGRFSPQPTPHTFLAPSSSAYANFNGNVGNQKVVTSNGYSHIHPMNGYPQSTGSSSSHSYSPYKVLMESKATNI